MSNPYEGDGQKPALQLPPLAPLHLKPYNFEIKDYDQMKNLLHCNMPIGAPVIKCPDFHVQLDHTIAVLWLFYSDHNNWCKLTTIHLEWAIRFIDGVISLAVDGDLRDVETIKRHLEELLIVYYADVDLDKFAGETGRITAMPVIEQTTIQPFEQEKILQTVQIPAKSSTSPALRERSKQQSDEKHMMKQLSTELAHIKKCRAKIKKRLRSACKVNRLIQDVKSQAADIKRLREDLLSIIDASNFIL